jgi:hypothetical protein
MNAKALFSTLLIIAGTVFSVYGGVFLFTYAGSDDAAFLWASLNDPFWATREVSQDGRFLKGLFVDLLFMAVDDVAGLRWGRLIFLILLCGVGLQISWLANRWGASKMESLALGLWSVVAIPFVDLAALIPSMAAPLAVVAAGFSIFVLEEKDPFAKGNRHRIALSVLLLVIAFGIYQPAAMTVVFFSALATLLKNGDWPVQRRRLLSHGVVILSAGLVAFILFLRLLPGMLSVTSKGREALTFHFLHKMGWFFALPLRDALNPFWFFAQDPLFAPGVDRSSVGAIIESTGGLSGLLFTLPNGVALIVALFIAAGLFFADRIEGKRAVHTWALRLAYLPAAYALNLVVATFWSPPRTLLALSLVVLLLLLLALRGFPPGRGEGAQRAILLLFTLVFALNGLRVHTAFVGRPLATEWAQVVAHVQMVEKQLQGAATPQTVYFARPQPDQTWAPGIRFELGRPASATTWGAPALFGLAWRLASQEPPPELRVVSSVTEIPNFAVRIVLTPNKRIENQ